VNWIQLAQVVDSRECGVEPSALGAMELVSQLISPLRKQRTNSNMSFIHSFKLVMVTPSQ
jgi:hypothetical protein